MRHVLAEGWLVGDILGRKLCQSPILSGTLVLRGMRWLLDRLVVRPVSAGYWRASFLDHADPPVGERVLVLVFECFTSLLNDGECQVKSIFVASVNNASGWL